MVEEIDCLLVFLKCLVMSIFGERGGQIRIFLVPFINNFFLCELVYYHSEILLKLSPTLILAQRETAGSTDFRDIALKIIIDLPPCLTVEKKLI